jgi:hypothetical protein
LFLPGSTERAAHGDDAEVVPVVAADDVLRPLGHAIVVFFLGIFRAFGDLVHDEPAAMDGEPRDVQLRRGRVVHQRIPAPQRRVVRLRGHLQVPVTVTRIQYRGYRSSMRQ